MSSLYARLSVSFKAKKKHFRVKEIYFGWNNQYIFVSKFQFLDFYQCHDEREHKKQNSWDIHFSSKLSKILMIRIFISAFIDFLLSIYVPTLYVCSSIWWHRVFSVYASKFNEIDEDFLNRSDVRRYVCTNSERAQCAPIIWIFWHNKTLFVDFQIIFNFFLSFNGNSLNLFLKIAQCIYFR